MKKALGTVIALWTVAIGIGATRAADDTQVLGWAYAIPPPGAPAAPAARDDGTLFSLPGTDRKFTLNQIRGRRDNDTPGLIAPADWYPNDHPVMPKIIAEGDNGRGITACALCHYPNGRGRPENAGLAGLPKDYIVRQLHNMQADLRQSAERRKGNSQQMITFAKAMTEDEVQTAAAYFSSIPWTPWIRVVETNSVPKVRSQGGMWIPLEGAAVGTEPIGERIIDTPENAEHTETLRDPRSSFIAYVPTDAVTKGKELVSTGGGGKTIQCALCHGDDLSGIGSVPGIAARSPSYLARQLNDFKQGARHGGMADLMRRVVIKLTPEDMLDIVAYTATLPTSARAPTTAAP